jgi:hypothetical protein
MRGGIPTVLIEMLRNFNDKIHQNINENYWVEIARCSFEYVDYLKFDELKLIELCDLGKCVGQLSIIQKKYAFDEGLLNRKLPTLIFEYMYIEHDSIYNDYEECELKGNVYLIIDVENKKIHVLMKNSDTHIELMK